MYAAAFDTVTRVGWILALVAGVLLAARAVRVEQRHVRPPRTRLARALDVGVDSATVLALVGFAAVLVLVVYSTFLGWFR